MQHLLLAVSLFLASTPTSKDPEPAPEQTEERPAFTCTERPCLKGLVLNGDIISMDIAYFFKSRMDEAVEAKADAIMVIINSPGGEITASRLLYWMFRLSPIPVYCITTDRAASGAFWALEGCTYRSMTEDAQLMTHEPFVVTNVPLRRQDLREAADELDASVEKMAEECSYRLAITSKQFKERIAESDWWMDKDEALKVKAVDGVHTDADAFVDYVKDKFTVKGEEINGRSVSSM
jgi:ATP-dependent protease ClpP protease subunit